MEWVNPHAWIHIDVEKDDGTDRGLDGRGRRAERAAAPRLQQELPAARHGHSCVEGYQAKDGAMRANGRDITFEDGTKLFVGSSGTGAPRDGRDPTER